jgi:hypothetical protein
MTRFIALVITLPSLFVAATNVNTKYTSKGYNAYASVQYQGCEYLYGSQVDTSVYAGQSKFKEVVGDVGMVQTNVYDDFFFSFASSSCNDTHVTYKRGAVYEYENYGDNVNTEFKIEGVELTKASLKGIEVPVYGNECTYVCNEVCYAEIFGWGTCPPELPTYECYTLECSEETYMGNAKVSAFWRVPNRLGNAGLTTSSSMYRYRSEGQTYMSKSRGSYRYDVPVKVNVTLNGSNLFSSAPLYTYADLGNTRSKEVTKTKCPA